MYEIPPNQMAFRASRDGTRLAYATSGAGSPLVWVQHWVHHLKFDWESPVWQPWLSMFSRRNTLVRYDWRGCGLSDRDGVEFSLEKFAEDLDAVITAAEFERFVLFGMGGVGGAISTSTPPAIRGESDQLILHGSYARGEDGRATRRPHNATRRRRGSKCTN